MQFLARRLVEQIESVVVSMRRSVEVQANCRLRVRCILNLVQADFVTNVRDLIPSVQGLLQRMWNGVVVRVRTGVERFSEVAFQHFHYAMCVCMVVNG